MKIKDNVSDWQILQALFNGTRPVCWGMFQPGSHEPLSDADAKAFCMGQPRVYVDYCNGRPIKVNLSERPMPNLRLYDRDAGDGKGVLVLQRAGLIED